MHNSLRNLRLSLLIAFFFIPYYSAYSQESWSVTLPSIGTFSSPRLSDLNKDGVKDIILGGGRLEFQKCDTAMFALSGVDGSLLWKVSAIDQIFGSAALRDITGDGIDDPILYGRSSELKAINGFTGEVIWSFDTLKHSNNGTKRWFNFYSPQFIHDLDGDGLGDILVSNGGDVLVEAYNENRAAGRLVIISAKTGDIISSAQMPDGREIYQSIVIDFNKTKPNESKVYFGTGGETIDGSFFVATVQMVLNGDLLGSRELAKGEGKGFIGPPVLVDLNSDGINEVVVISVNGRVMAFNGIDQAKLWETKIEETEAYSSLAVGFFNEDSTPDFFLSVAQGIWPELSWTKQAMLDGKNGNIEFTDFLGYYQTSSPIAADIDGDGIDEIILNVDYQVLDSIGQKMFYNNLYAIRFASKETIPIYQDQIGHNVSSTPWIGDMDNDGNMDMVFCHGINKYKTYTFDGLQINCLRTTIPITKPISWGSYMGSKGDGVFRK